MLTLIENTELFFFSGVRFSQIVRRSIMTIILLNPAGLCPIGYAMRDDAPLTKVVASAEDDLQPHSLSMPKANQFALNSAAAVSTFPARSDSDEQGVSMIVR